MKTRSLKRDIRMVFLGALITALILPGISVLANVVTRELHFTGITVQVDGVPVEFATDSQPFIMEGRTFLPAGAIAGAVGKEVSWDAETQTVHLNTPGVAVAQPAQAARPLFVEFPRPDVTGSAANANRDGGQNATFGSIMFANSWISHNSTGTNDITLPLNGQWNEISGYIGAHSSLNRGVFATVSVFGDGGVMLGGFTAYYGEPAFPFSVNVEGQQEVIIRIVRNAEGGISAVGVTLLSPQIR